MQFSDPFLIATPLSSAIALNILAVPSSTLLVDLLGLLEKAPLSCDLTPHKRSLYAVKKQILVLEDNIFLGIISQQNLIQIIITNPNWTELKTQDILATDYITINQNEVKNLFAIISLFHQHQLEILPVLNSEGQLVSLITLDSILQTLQLKELLQLQKVKTFYSPDLLQANCNQNLQEIALIFAETNTNFLVINQEEKIIGTISTHDIIQSYLLKLDFTQITGEMIMNPYPPVIKLEDSLADAFTQMQHYHSCHLMVINSQQEYIGQITSYNLLQVFDPLEMCRILTYRQLELERQIDANLVSDSIHSKNDFDQRELEIRIQARTSQLRHLNQQLMREIAERNTIEKSLRDSEERLRTIITTNADALLVIDQQGKVLFVNPAAEILLGRSAEKLLGQLLGLPITVDELAEVEIFLPNRQLRFAEMRVVEITWEQHQTVYLASLRDVTDRKKSEEIIRASEEELRSTFEQVAVGIAHVDLEGTFLKVNQKICQILQYSSEELLTKNLIDFSLFESLEEDWTEIEYLLNNTKSTFTKEQSYRCQDGSFIWGKITVSLVEKVTGEPDYFILVLEDISEQKKAETALIESRRQYQDLVNSIEAVVWEAEFPEYRVIFVSQNVEKILGYTVEQCLTQQDIWVNNINPKDRAKTLVFRENAIENQQNYEVEYRMLTADGRSVWLRDIVNLIIKDSQVIKLQGITIDISQQKQVENSLKESQNRLQLLNSITTRITAGMLVSQIIELTVEQIQEYFPDFRVAYATVNSEGMAVFSYSLQPKFMPSVQNIGFELSAIPEIWQTLSMGIPVIIENISQDPRISEMKHIFMSNATKSLICVPLQQREQLGGLLFLDSAITQKWNQYEILLLRDVADYLSVAIKEAQAQQERFEIQYQLIEQSKHLEKFTLNLTKLHQVNTHQYDKIETLFTDYLKIGCDIFNLMTGIISKIRGNCYIVQSVVSNISALHHGFVMELDQTFCELVIQEKTTLIYYNIHQNETLRSHPAYQQFRIKNYLGTPIIVNGEIYGTLNFFSNQTRPEEFEDYEREFIELMAQSLGKYIEANQIEKDRQLTLEELRKNQTFIQRIAQTIPNLLYIYDLVANSNVYINSEIASILGYTADEIQGMDEIFFTKLISPEYLKQLEKHFHKFDVIKDGEIVELEYQIRDKNDRLHWLYSRDILFTRTLDGKPKQILGTATDITRQKSVENELQETNNKLINWVKELEQRNQEITLLGELTEVLQACLSIKEAYHTLTTLLIPLFPDTSGTVFILNNSNNFLEPVAYWGKQREENLFTSHECWGLRRGRTHWLKYGQHHLICPHLENIPDLNESLCIPLMAQGETLGLLWLSLFADSKETRFTEANRQLAITVSEHISLALANLQLREKLQNQSVRDPLTGLFNRRYMEESLAREIHRATRQKKSVGILMLDVDHFKNFNDTFGHELGDKVLQELGEFLSRSIRNSDIACRYGGEEFMLILPDTTLPDTIKRAEEICQGVKRMKIEYHYQSIDSITASLGVAVFPDHGNTVENLVWAADVALYQAKAQGRDRVVIAQYCP
jgi:diguanylate cyclase (GGDEF)-like protein/PAS domain S-box-containing protein